MPAYVITTTGTLGTDYTVTDSAGTTTVDFLNPSFSYNFIANSTLVSDYLVVGGGGSGFFNGYAGGGGGGEVLSGNSSLLGSYVVYVGAGGVASGSTTGNGDASIFGAIIA